MECLTIWHLRRPRIGSSRRGSYPMDEREICPDRWSAKRSIPAQSRYRKKAYKLATARYTNPVRLRRCLVANSVPKSAYKLINEAFIAGRKEADFLGLDRVAACQTALDAFDQLASIAPHMVTPAFHRWVVERCLRVGLMPSFAEGWTGLFKRLTTQYFKIPGPSMVYLAKRKLFGSRNA